MRQFPDRPLVIAHRGASGYLPEHTLAAYTLAVRQGADYIEPDLVCTRDGILVARHENEIGSTTDAATRFPERQATRTVDGREVSGWFVEDLDLVELQSLRARERLPFRSHEHDGEFAVPTFEEVLDLIELLQAETGRVIGLYPETKHPTYFRALGLPLEEPLLAALHGRGLDGPESPVFIQSFETGNLRWLRARTGLRLIQLLGATGAPWDWHVTGVAGGYAKMVQAGGLREIATYAAGIGPDKHLVIPTGGANALGAATSLVEDAHTAGLVVHPWTFRDDPEFLDSGYRGDPVHELQLHARLGVDGVFADFPDTAVAAFGALRRDGLA